MEPSWVELRVHGVSGTAPESMLDFDRVRQVAGDELGRFFRRFDERGEELPGPDGQAVEAYHWGKFTSGSWTYALWLLLAPFGIVNAAQFMLEPPRGPLARLFHTIAGAALRVVSLALTALLVLSAAIVTMDLWAWQKVGPSTTGWERWVPAVAMLGPVAVIALFIFLGRSRLPQEESRPPDHPPQEPPSGFVEAGFFAGDSNASALRWLHVGCGLGMVALLGFAPLQADDHALAVVGFRAALGLSVAVLLGVTFLGDPANSASISYQSTSVQTARAAIHRAAEPVSRALAALGGVLLISVAVMSRVFVVTAGRDGNHPGVDRVAFVVMVASVAGMLTLSVANGALALASRKSRPANRRFRPFAWGLASFVVTSFGVFVGVGYAGAFALAAQQAIGAKGDGVDAPELLRRIVYAWGITALVLVLLGLLAGVWWLIRIPTHRRRAVEDFTRDDRPLLPDRWIGDVAMGMWVARLKNRLVFLLVTFSVVGVTLSLATVLELLPSWSGTATNLPNPFGALSESDSAMGSLSVSQQAFVIWLGGITLGALATQLIILGRTALLGEDKRRAVNVLWDVIAFWPRSVHPLVPVAYSQRAVEDIRERLTMHLADASAAKEGVVLCGHSQGSLLCFAATVRMRSDPAQSTTLERIGFLTYGSQLQVLFSRAFPTYVNLPTIEWLHEQLAERWINLYRETDYLAGPVLSWEHEGVTAIDITSGGQARPGSVHCSRRQFGPDWKLLDPPRPDPWPPVGAARHERPLLPMRKHSDFWQDESWVDAVRWLRPNAASAGQQLTQTEPGQGGVGLLDVDQVPGG